MSTSSDRATSFAMGLAVGMNTLAALAMPDVVRKRLRGRGSAAWRSSVASTLGELERACESLKDRTSDSNLKLIRTSLSELASLLKSRRSTVDEISSASKSSLERLKKVLGLPD